MSCVPKKADKLNLSLYLSLSCGIHLGKIPQEILRMFILDMSLRITNLRLQPLRITNLRLQPHLPSTSELGAVSVFLTSLLYFLWLQSSVGFVEYMNVAPDLYTPLTWMAEYTYWNRRTCKEESPQNIKDTYFYTISQQNLKKKWKIIICTNKFPNTRYIIANEYLAWLLWKLEVAVMKELTLLGCL